MIDRWFVTRPRKLLLSTDLHEHGSIAVRVGADWATRLGASVAACHVVRGSDGSVTVGHAHDDSRDTAARVCSHLSDAVPGPTRVEVLVGHGDPARQIIETAEECSADLIVVGAPAGELGPVAAGVLEAAHCSVLVARQLVAEGPILAACDLSDASLAAVSAAATAARQFDVPLAVVHATGKDGDRSLPDPIKRAMTTALDAALAGVRVRADIRIFEGPAPEGILFLERGLAATLVVVGARGVSRTPRKALGSVARDIASRARTSVLVLRAVAGVAG